MSESIISEAYYEPLSIIWNYLRYPCEMKTADCIVGFGNYNCDIALRASELYKKGYARKILFSGGLGRNTLGLQSLTEAESFARTAFNDGVPESDILIENKSTNTAENIRFTRNLLEENRIDVGRLIIVHQPFMERRIRSAFDIVWPGVELLTTSYECDIKTFFERAARFGMTERAVIEEVVGDFQRMKLYAEKGWQSEQHIPKEKWEAFDELVRMGYTGQLA